MALPGKQDRQIPTFRKGYHVKRLHQIITGRVQAWRTAGYEGTDYPAIAEILEYQMD
jgi:hypothetical protein